VRELAQVNVAVMRAPVTSPSMAGFVFAFDAVARLADSSPGLVWRSISESGHATVVGDGGVDQMVNLSVWRDYRSMHQFVYRSGHGQVLFRRRDWFGPTPQPSTALWWVHVGERPTIDEALAQLGFLRRHGSSPRAFSLLRQFDAGGRPAPRRPPR
jgi:hypothetical protein